MSAPPALVRNLTAAMLIAACAEVPPLPDPTPQAISPFKNVAQPTEYVGDATCTSCHAAEAASYSGTNMARSFQRWTPSTRVETLLAQPLQNTPSGYSYVVEQRDGALYQVEFLDGPGGQRLHELRRRMDWVVGSGNVARTYFTEENGRLFQLPLTWYKDHGWDFSPGYEINNARFDRLAPDRCVVCHSNFPKQAPHLEGKHAEWRPGIGCERCHGPGALHVEQRGAKAPLDSTFDLTIVNPARLSLDRRVDVCEECHVHTAVSVLREGKGAFSYRPSLPLADQYAYFKVAGSIDVVSHADRLRQSACFLGSAGSAQPLECATCHKSHQPAARGPERNKPCLTCHTDSSLVRRLSGETSAVNHRTGSDCVRCHMPRTEERTVPHGSFTEHWIRVVKDSAPPTLARSGDALIEPYFTRDKSGPDAAIYTAMGGVVYATLASDARALGQAADTLASALGKDRTRREALFLLGAANEQIGRTTEAIQALERAVRADSNRPDALRALAQAYARDGSHADRLEPLYRRALQLQPALAWIRAEYAEWLQRVGRLEEAEREYRAAVAEQPSLATAWFGLGLLHAQRGAGTEAADGFRESVRLDPSLARALNPLIEVTVSGKKLTTVRALHPLPEPQPLGEPRAGAFHFAVAGSDQVTFMNVPVNGFVLLMKPDGTLLAAIPASGGSTVPWDFVLAPGKRLEGGLYRVQVQGRDAAGVAVPPQAMMMGVVRRDR